LKITFNRLSEDQVIICCWEFGWKHYEHKWLQRMQSYRT
jgi:hypothetical protein